MDQNDAAAVAMGQLGERAVVVTTEYRGVFFGYTDYRFDPSVPTIEALCLRRARNCIYWPASVRGFLGLAAVGPLEGSRVGHAADVELRKITCVAQCSPEAAQLWESAPWSD